MKTQDNLVILVLIFMAFGLVQPSQLENVKKDRSLALAFVDNPGSVINKAVSAQWSPKGITGQLVVSIVILVAETIGYSVFGKRLPTYYCIGTKNLSKLVYYVCKYFLTPDLIIWNLLRDCSCIT